MSLDSPVQKTDQRNHFNNLDNQTTFATLNFDPKQLNNPESQH